MTQNQALDILKTGANVFLTGEPGSGKTYTINRYIDYLRRHAISPAITASTGIAATHIGGMTLHSWSGIGISKFLSDQDVERVAGKSKIARRLEKTSVLIIDEISMLDAATLDLVERVCRKGKQSELPWGGIQIIFIGDFFQLPPVSGRGEPQPKFAYQSDTWRRAEPLVCYLSEQHRQEDDTFLDILARIRKGAVDEDLHAVLAGKIVPGHIQKDFTKLYSHNVDVDRINDAKLDALPGKEFSFRMDTRGPRALTEQIMRGCLSPEILRLKVGAKVMFTKNNFEHGYVNGTLGEVTSLSDVGPVVKTTKGDMITVTPADWSIADGNKILARIIQYPLRLAWAMTIHKSQGMTLDSAVMDLASVFEYGQGYVALSRVRALSGLYLLGINSRALAVHPEVLTIDTNFRDSSDTAEARYVNGDALGKQAEEFLVHAGGQLAEVVPEVAEEYKSGRRLPKVDTYAETLKFWQEGLLVAEIAERRKLTATTITSHIEELYMRDQIALAELQRLVSQELSEALPEIQAVLKESDGLRLSPVYEKFAGKYTYDQLRLARLLMPN
jgi:ATP-dependent DNA helicase PIF1